MKTNFYPDSTAGSTPNPGRTPGGAAALWRLLVLCCVLALGVASPAHASHFRYGSITWRTVTTDATKRTVQIKVSESFRKSYINFSPSLTVGSVVSAADVLYFGDGTNTNINLTVTSVDVAADNFYGEFTVTHTYASVAAYKAYINNSARLGTLVNNANAYWHIETVVNAGTGNNSPVSTLPPVVNLATGQTAATFQLPANDPDGDPLTYSLATAADMGGNAFTNAPGLAINATTGVITFPTTGKTVGALYDAIVKVSDGKTSVMVDFIIQITKVSTPPAFDYSLTPSSGYVYQVAPGKPVNFSVRATDSDAGDIVTLKAVGLPAGSSMSPSLPATGNPVTSAFSWTPTTSNLGSYVLTFVAQDNVGVQTNTSVTIQVSTKPTFDVPPTPSNGSLVQITPGTLITRTIQASNADPATLVRITSATGLPASATYSPALPTTAANPTSTQLDWTPVLADWGPHTVTFTAANTNSSDKGTHMLQFIVNSAPSFTSAPAPASLNVVAGQPFSYNITLTDPDLPYGDQLEIEDQTLPAWLTLVDNGNGTGTLSGTPTVADAGSNPVELVAADTYHHGNSYGLITQSFDINVIPCTMQAMAQNVTVGLDANGQVTVTSAQVDNGSTASCGIASMSVSPNTFTCANIGANPVTLTVTDSYGNVSTATATVTVTDATAPTAVAQNVTVQLDANGQATVTAAQVDNGSSDNCAVASTTVSPSSFTCANVGPNAVTLTVTDASGNVSTATATVTVQDNTLPTITAPAAVSVSTDAGQCTATNVALGAATAADNCTVTVTNDAPVSFPKGATTVTWTATDAAGNVATATQAVTVNDTELPTITAPAAVSVSTDASQCSATSVALGTATASDNCAGVVVANNAPASYAKGTTTVTWTATDAAGNVATATQTVTVNDTELPTITAPAAVLVSTNPGQCSATQVALGNATAGDNCTGVAVTNNAPASYPKGTTTVTWTATDAAGNVATATQAVTVNDTELPTIMAPAAITANTNPGQCAATGVALGNATAGDNCTGLVVTNNAPASFPKGVTTVTWKAADMAGNMATATQTVTVKDTERPIITAPMAVSVSTNPGQCAATGVALGNATAGDNCTGVVVANNAPASYPKGTTTVTWTATDASGNVATAAQTVTVKDTELPTITAPAAVAVAADASQCAATNVALGNATAGDNCADVTVSNNAPASYPKGTTTVTWTATDAAGNVATATQTVTVTDRTAPVALARNVSVQLNASGKANVSAAQVNNGSSDNCGIASVTVSPSAFTCANVGPNAVTLTITDNSSNVSTATATVMVVDAIAPTAIAQNVSVQLNASGQASVSASQVNNGSSDNCGIASLALSKTAFTCANVGANPVTLTITDNSGNVSTATATVTVVDATAPVVLTRNLSVQLNANGSASITAAQVNNGSYDNCGIASVSVAPSSFSCTNLGPNAVTLTVTDNSGNVSTAPATITVQDLIAPTFSSCPANISVTAQPGDCTPVVNWTAPTAADNCSFTLFASHKPGTRFAVGTTLVTYTATDRAGNTATFSFSVTVTPTPVVVALSSPTFAGGFNIGCAGSKSGSATAAVSGGCQPYRYQWSNGQTTSTATGLAAGSYSVTVTDANNTSVVRTIVLTQPTALALSTGYSPQATFQGANTATVYLGYGQQSLTLSATASGGVAGYSYRWSPATGLSSTTSASVTATPTMTTTYTVTATDQNGCSVSRTITVNVVDARCGNNGNNDKVTMCHNGHEICIDANGVPAHLAQGDVVGPCTTNARTVDTGTATATTTTSTTTSATTTTSAKAAAPALAKPLAEVLLEAYPNPFNASTTVHFRPLVAAATQVRVYDVLGHVVATLFEGVTEAGHDYTLTLSGEQLASGIYFCRYESQGKVLTQRLALVK
ncbi:MAG: HYR domain-containing protein [Janthinobacterium lividum]